MALVGCRTWVLYFAARNRWVAWNSLQEHRDLFLVANQSGFLMLSELGCRSQPASSWSARDYYNCPVECLRPCKRREPNCPPSCGHSGSRHRQARRSDSDSNGRNRPMQLSFPEEVQETLVNSTKIPCNALQYACSLVYPSGMNQTSNPEAAASVPFPYVAYKTFKTAIDRFGETDLPSRLDHSAFPTMAGGTFSQLRSAFRFLDLIDDEGVPTESLSLLVNATETKPILRDLVKRAYADIFDALDIAKGTPAQLEQAIKNSGVSGDTARKARVFFLKLVEESGMEVSQFIKTVGSQSPTRKPRKSRAKPEAPAKPAVASSNGSSTVAPSERRHRIQVGETGYAELVLAYDEFEITSDDQTELRKVVDAFKGFGEMRNDQGQRLLAAGEAD